MDMIPGIFLPFSHATVWVRVSAFNQKHIFSEFFFFFTDSLTCINKPPSSQLESTHSPKCNFSKFTDKMMIETFCKNCVHN